MPARIWTQTFLIRFKYPTTVLYFFCVCFFKCREVSFEVFRNEMSDLKLYCPGKALEFGSAESIIWLQDYPGLSFRLLPIKIKILLLSKRILLSGFWRMELRIWYQPTQHLVQRWKTISFHLTAVLDKLLLTESDIAFQELVVVHQGLVKRVLVFLPVWDYIKGVIRY